MEKGGKGLSPTPRAARKSALKSAPPKQASLKGKDDTPTKSKRGRKVQFSAEGLADANPDFSPKSGGKIETTFPKGDSSKWGKGDKTSTGGKIPISKEPQPPELKVEQDLPDNVKCMMDCEAADILQGIEDQMGILSRDPEFKLPVSFDKGLQYAKRDSHYTNPQSVRQVLNTLTKYGVTDGEICVIANICPDSIDEVFALVPSLKAKRSKLSQPLRDVLSELSNLKKSAGLESRMGSAKVDIPDT